MSENYLREIELADERYLMKMKVVAEGCLLGDPTRFGAYYRLDFDHQV